MLEDVRAPLSDGKRPILTQNLPSAELAGPEWHWTQREFRCL